MRTFIVTGFFALALTACGDDSGTDDGSNASTGTSTTAPGSSTGTPGSTTDAPGTTDTTAADSTGVDSTGADSSEGSESTGTVAFELTSPAFADGEEFPQNMHISCGNVHPQLDWVGAPAGTMSFGVFFYDEVFMGGYEHSGIWNIPADATGLPEGIEAVAMPPSVPGAVQCRHWNGGFGYGGPGSFDNMYTFTVYALDVADLSDEIDENSSRVEVREVLQAHAIDEAVLGGVTMMPCT